MSRFLNLAKGDLLVNEPQNTKIESKGAVRSEGTTPSQSQHGLGRGAAQSGFGGGLEKGDLFVDGSKQK